MQVSDILNQHNFDVSNKTVIRYLSVYEREIDAKSYQQRKQHRVSAKLTTNKNWILPCKASERLICKSLALSACKYRRARNVYLYIQIDTDKKENEQKTI